MTKKDKDFLMELVKQGKTFKEIRDEVTCSDYTIRLYIRVFKNIKKDPKILKMSIYK